MHLSKTQMLKMQIKGIDFSEITLHVGLGTFHPIMVEDLSKHKMESEQMIIGQEAAEKINKTLENRKKVCAIGTTVMRSLESSVSTKNQVIPFNGWTNIFIFPPYEFKIASCMLTNFHLPKSSL